MVEVDGPALWIDDAAHLRRHGAGVEIVHNEKPGSVLHDQGMLPPSLPAFAPGRPSGPTLSAPELPVQTALRLAAGRSGGAAAARGGPREGIRIKLKG